jgi:hypothetical protein
MKTGFIRKTGVPLSDEATLDWRFFRHGDLLTVLMVARDPIYLVEPEIISKSFRLSKVALDFRDPCVPGFEGREPGDDVPHFAPGQNPFLDEFMKLYNLPREAVLGYRDTLYPEYRKKIKNTYVPPPPCTADCGVAGNFVRRRSG